MKGRIVPIAACFTVLLLSAALAACQPEHQHTFSEEWAFDATHHWHEATCEHSGERSDYAEHTWDSGTVTTAAMCETAGVMTYTCTVCDAARQQTTPATGHVWDDGEVTTPAGCLTDGTTTYTCTVCDATKQETIPATGHILEKEWTTDDTHHWHKACEHNADKNEYGEHNYNENNVCTVCGMGYVSAGLVYTLSEDGTYYSVTNIGTCTDTVIYIPSAYNGLPVKEIGKSAFYGKKTITGVVLSDGITTINIYAFYNCSSLASVTIPDSVTSIGSTAFYGCSGLASVTIGNGVTGIGNSAFYGCSGLTSVTIGNGVTGIGNSAFEGCGLTSVTIPDSVTSIGDYAFNNCSSLTSITIPDSVTGSIGNSAFYGCNGLTSVTIGNSVTGIGDYAFEGCSNLASVTIGNGVTSIGYSAFYGCSSLTSVTIPDSVTGIGVWAFYGCSNLASVTIGKNVTIIAALAFEGCSSLTSVTFANPKGWSRSLRGDEYQSIPSQHLENASMAATFLRRTYCACDWRRG